jgi:hypothetical protein
MVKGNNSVSKYPPYPLHIPLRTLRGIYCALRARINISSKLYADHCRALESAGLPVPKSYPTLREELNKIEERMIEESNIDPDEAERKKAKKARDRERATYFCIGYSTFGASHSIKSSSDCATSTV